MGDDKSVEDIFQPEKPFYANHGGDSPPARCKWVAETSQKTSFPNVCKRVSISYPKTCDQWKDQIKMGYMNSDEDSKKMFAAERQEMEKMRTMIDASRSAAWKPKASSDKDSKKMFAGKK